MIIKCYPLQIKPFSRTRLAHTHCLYPSRAGVLIRQTSWETESASFDPDLLISDWLSPWKPVQWLINGINRSMKFQGEEKWCVSFIWASMYNKPSQLFWTSFAHWETLFPVSVLHTTKETHQPLGINESWIQRYFKRIPSGWDKGGSNDVGLQSGDFPISGSS